MKYRINLILIFLILTGFLLRLGLVLTFTQPLIHGDDIGYHLDAVNFFNNYLFNPAQLEGFVRPVLYPFFLYVIYKIFGGAIPLNAYIAQAFLYILSAAALYFIARQVFNKATGLWAVLGFSLYPPLIWHTGVLYAENLFITILLIAVLLFLQALKYQKKVYYLFSGVALGLGYLCRPIIYHYFYILLVYLLWFFRKKIKDVSYPVLTFSAGFLIILAPWIIRNSIITKTFIPLNHGKGIALLYANAKLPTDDFLGEPSYSEGDKVLKEFRPSYQQDKQTIAGRDLLYYNAARNLIIHYPFRYLMLSMKRLARLWLNVGYGYKPSFLAIMIAIGNTIMLILSLMPFLFFKGRWIKKALPITILIAYFTVIHMFTHAVFRYIYPVIPFVIMFSAYSVYRLLILAKKRERNVILEK